jgi:hypothetical protein
MGQAVDHPVETAIDGLGQVWLVWQRIAAHFE